MDYTLSLEGDISGEYEDENQDMQFFSSGINEMSTTDNFITVSVSQVL